MPRLAFFVLLLVYLSGCDTSNPDPEPQPLPAADEIIAGVNLTRLFAQPTRTDLDGVRAVWDARTRGRGERYEYVEVDRGTDSDAATLIVFEGRLAQLDGAPAVHHVLLRIPARAPGDVQRLPLLLVSPRTTRSSANDLLLDPQTEGLLREGAAQALVTLRGGTLEALGQNFHSSTSESPYDFDTEDALAALGALTTVGFLPQEVDAEQVAWTGFGRGGTVALLSAARSGQVRAVTSWAAPTGFLLPSVYDDVARRLRGGDPADLPSFDAIYRNIIFTIRDDEGRLTEARRELLLRSPLYFSEDLPPAFIVHSSQDRTVPFEHADRLDASIEPEPPFDIALFPFLGAEITPSHEGTFSSPRARRDNAQFLAYHLGL